MPGREGGDIRRVGDIPGGDPYAAVRQAAVAGRVADHRGDLVSTPTRFSDGLPAGPATGPENHEPAHRRNTSR